MKIGHLGLDNTELKLLALVRKCPMMPARAMVYRVYPNTKQPDKKEDTFMKCLRRLERFGLIRQIGDGWFAPYNRAGPVRTSGGAA